MTPSAAVWPRVSPVSRPVPGAPMAALIYTDPAATLRPRHAPVAQLDRASVYGTEGQRFESSRARSRSPATAGLFLPAARVVGHTVSQICPELGDGIAGEPR